MATRSIIAKLDDKGVQAIYCHNDGYLSNNGKILDQHYTDCSKLNAFANARTLQSFISPFANTEPNVTS